jgi:hypothetical protein
MQQPLKMIETGAPNLDLFFRQIKDMRNVVASAENALAQSQGPDTAVFAERQNDAAFRIGKVDHQGVRTKLLHVARKVEHQRQRAQGEEQSSRSAIFAQRLADPVFSRHFEVEAPESVAVDYGRVKDKACTRQSLAALGRRFDLQSRA